MLQNEMLSLPKCWESILERMLLCGPAGGGNQRKAYICSPCRSDTSLGIQRNIKAARVYMFYSNCCRAVLRRVFEQKRSGAGLER